MNETKHISDLAQKNTMRKYKLAVIGNPIQHSLSPSIHHVFADSLGLQVQYEKLLAAIDEEGKDFAESMSHFFEHGGHGLNVTVPFKQVAYRSCDVVSTRAKTAQAVNTLYIQDGKLHGDNTDGAGLVNALQSLSQNCDKWQLKNKRVAIIGAGGACRGVILPLLESGVESITIANRTLSKAEQLVTEISHATDVAPAQLMTSSIEDLHGHFHIIINATSTSLYGHSLIVSDTLTCDCAYDMVYQKNNALTPFLTHFQNRKSQVADGFSMLIGQAAVSFAIWTGCSPNLTDLQIQAQLKEIMT